MIVNIHNAKTNLSKLIEAMLNGEEVIIAKGNKPVARLEPIKKTKFKFGLIPELAGTGPDFLEPMDDEELAMWEGRT
jgi:antitoxin (DNA-binding transcriptional repressor) of toxin-antitoxin stability system